MFHLLVDRQEISIGYIISDHIEAPSSIGIGFDYKMFHIDYADNLVSSKPYYSEGDKRPTKMINVGYNILVAPYTILTPRIGYYEIDDDTKTFNVGVNIKMTEMFGLNFSFGIGFRDIGLIIIGVPL